MADGQRRFATYEDLCAVPEHLIAEIIDGALITQPRPGPGHALATSVIGSALVHRFHLGQDGGAPDWWILDEPEIHSAGQIVVPDIAGWRRSRMPTLPETAHFDLAPDWVCEALSPSTAQRDRGRKSDVYAEMGVSWYWLIDPDAEVLEVFELSNGRWLRFGAFSGAQKVMAPPFETAEIALAPLWGRAAEPDPSNGAPAPDGGGVADG